MFYLSEPGKVQHVPQLHFDFITDIIIRIFFLSH